MLDQILYFTENGLMSLMVLHDFLSKCLTPSRIAPARVDVHQGERHHAAGSSARVEPGRGLTSRVLEGADLRLVFGQAHGATNSL
jgi:hypothetical protein